jgi:hypothetical protein
MTTTSEIFQFSAEDEAVHRPGPDRWWQESIAIHWCDPAQRVGGMHRIGHEPGQKDGGLIAHNLGVFGGEQRFRHNVTSPLSGQLDDRYFGDAAHNWRFDDGVGRLSLRTEDCEVDLHVENLYPITDFFPRGNSSLTDEFAAHHYETSGVATGTARIGNATYDINGYCHRDHSWGIRRWADALAAHRWVSGVLGRDLCFGSVAWLAPDGSLAAAGYVVRDGEVSIAERADVVVWTEIDATSHRGGELLLVVDGEELRFTCRAMDGWLNEHHGTIWLDKLCLVEHAGRTGYCDFETSENARMGRGPVYVCAGAAMTNGLTSRTP